MKIRSELFFIKNYCDWSIKLTEFMSIKYAFYINFLQEIFFNKKKLVSPPRENCPIKQPVSLYDYSHCIQIQRKIFTTK